MKALIPVISLLIIAVSSCVDPFYLELEDFENRLVVEALITDELAPNTIKLSRTFQDKDASLDLLENAQVSVRDELGVISVFHEYQPGIYLSDSTSFRGRIGGTYTLSILTDDGLEFISTPSTMSAVPAIDSVYYELDSEIFETGTVEEAGLRIFLDAENQDTPSDYLRWEFEEVWEFRVPNPILSQDLGFKKYKTGTAKNDICWRYEQSKQILIHSTADQDGELMRRKPIHFIASAKSDRLLRQYSIQLSQYSISREEFLFWEKLKEITESEGDIFEKQPFHIAGNISCINAENVNVLGFFSVSAVKQKRIYITKSQIDDLDMPPFEYPCERIIYPNRVLHELLYNNLLSDGYVLFYVEESEFPGPPVNFQFTSIECADCTLSGKPEKPAFWVDMD